MNWLGGNTMLSIVLSGPHTQKLRMYMMFGTFIFTFSKNFSYKHNYVYITDSRSGDF